VAIGTFEPEIEIWCLDTLDVVFPSLILGSPMSSTTGHSLPSTPQSVSKKSKKKKQGSKAHLSSSVNVHTDAVLALSWSPLARSLLASGSADKTVKLWDLTSPASAVSSFDFLHSDKVSCLEWSPLLPSVLLSGGFDRRLNVFDVRDPHSASHKFELGAEIETAVWDPVVDSRLMVGLDDGRVVALDVRSNGGNSQTKSKKNHVSDALWTLSAHDGPVTALDISPQGLLVTGSSDKVVKIWNVSSSRPSCVASRDLNTGHVFSAKFSPDDPLTLCVGGAKGRLSLWNLESNSGVQSILANQNVAESSTKKKKKNETVTPKKEVLDIGSDEGEESDKERESFAMDVEEMDEI
jgi:periodic tryptophan protein 1